MNIYVVKFMGNCPNNNDIDNYTMRIKSTDTIMVEDILSAIDESKKKPMYQEDIYEFMNSRFEGTKINITGEHLGVKVITK